MIMSKETPLTVSEIKCPVCGSDNDYEHIIPGAYSETDRDTDFCPIGIAWANPNYQTINPLLYFTAVCHNCYFAVELNNSFKEASQNENEYNQIKAAHLEKLAEGDSIIKKIGSAIDCENYPNQAAILKLHLAVIGESLNDNCDFVKLGRFYLRIGWLFRHLNENANSDRQYLKPDIDSINKKIDNNSKLVEQLSDEMDSLHNLLKKHIKTNHLSNSMKNNITQSGDELIESHKTSTEEVKQIKQSFNDFNDKFYGYRKNILHLDENSQPEQSVSCYHEFSRQLTEFKQADDNIVADETAALSKARDCFITARKNHQIPSSGYQYLQTIYLIGELSRRINDQTTARKYFDKTIKEGQQFVSDNRDNPSRSALARKILELTVEQMNSNRELTAI